MILSCMLTCDILLRGTMRGRNSHRSSIFVHLQGPVVDMGWIFHLQVEATWRGIAARDDLCFQYYRIDSK